MEPWFQDALTRRRAEEQLLDAPVEVLVATLAFALVSFGALALVMFIAFHPSSWIAAWRDLKDNLDADRDSAPAIPAPLRSDEPEYAQARQVALSVAETIRREERFATAERSTAPHGPLQPQAAGYVGEHTPALDPDVALGTSHRRSVRRVSAAAARRDKSS